MKNSNFQSLDELAKVIDSLHQTPPYVSKGLSMVRVTDIKGGSIKLEDTLKVTKEIYDEFTKKYQPKKGDILMTRVGSYGTCSYVDTDENFCLGQNTVVIKPNINSEFLYYCLIDSNVKNQIESFVTGSTQKTISLKNIRSLNIPNPNNEKTILSVSKTLSNLDKKIELNNKINTELETMAKLIYDYWFVQFDFPDANGKPYKSSGGKMVYNETLKREIPDGWSVTELIEISNITTGKLDSNAEVVGGEFPFYTCAKDPATIDSYKYDEDVILIAGNNASGNFHVNRYSGKFNAYQRTYIVTAKEEKHLNYLYQVLIRQMKIYKNRGKGSQTKFLTIGMLTEINIFQPNTNLMTEYHKLTALQYEKQMIILRENKELESLRDWLLPMLMNGQVTVNDSEK